MNDEDAKFRQDLPPHTGIVSGFLFIAQFAVQDGEKAVNGAATASNPLSAWISQDEDLADLRDKAQSFSFFELFGVSARLRVIGGRYDQIVPGSG